ncbi:MAG: B12-binding domain-containing radical SAM protein, partial [Candidatus Hinthialibacter sp.]
LLRRCGVEVDFYDCLNRRSEDLEGLKPPPRHRLNPYGCGHYYREEIPLPPILDFVPRKFKRYGTPPPRVEERLRRLERPDAVIIAGMMTYWHPGVFEAAAMMRRLHPHAPILLGGVYATLCPDHAREFSGADAIVTGPHWPAIVNRIFEILGYDAECPGDQSTWIEPAYDLMRGDFCYPLLTSTGCPCHCAYCATHALWPRSLYYPREAILETIDRLVREFGATDVSFYDDALLIKKEEHFIPLMEEIVRRNYGLRFHTPNALHVRQIDGEVAGLLKRSGFTTIRLGLEFAQRDRQKATGGKVYSDEFVRAMESLRKAGFTGREAGAYVMYGLPDQTIEEVWEGCRFAAEQGCEVKLAMYSPIPGTPLFERSAGAFRFDPAADPLLQNCSLAPWRSRFIPYEEYQNLKKKTSLLNEKVRKTLFQGGKKP